MIKHFIYSKSDQSKTIKGTKGAGSFVVLSQFLYLYVKRKWKRINWTSQVTIQDGFIIHGSLHSIFFIIGNYVRNKLVLSYWKLNAEISGMNYGIFVLEVYNTQPTFGARSVWSKVQKIIIIKFVFERKKYRVDNSLSS